MENRYLKKFASKSDRELREIFDLKDIYNKDAIRAASIILIERGDKSIVIEEEDPLKEKIKEDINYLKEIGIDCSPVPWYIRLLHYIIDSFVINLIIILLAFTPLFSYSLLYNFILLPLYYIIMEDRFQQTLGKMATDSIIVDRHGNKVSTKQIILRTACRFVPFEIISTFGKISYPWHDKWSETYVIHKKDIDKVKQISTLITY